MLYQIKMKGSEVMQEGNMFKGLLPNAAAAPTSQQYAPPQFPQFSGFDYDDDDDYKKSKKSKSKKWKKKQKKKLRKKLKRELEKKASKKKSGKKDSNKKPFNAEAEVQNYIGAKVLDKMTRELSQRALDSLYGDSSSSPRYIEAKVIDRGK